jgi:integrase
LLRDKTNAVTAFFTFTQKPPQLVTPIDVKTWQAALKDQGLAPASVYAKVSRVSSWFRWALEDETLRETLHANPVALARPKAYQNEGAQALTDDEARELLDVVRSFAAEYGVRGIVGKRDFALLLFYLATGMRRAEVIRLRWGDLRVNGGLHVKTVRKGGEYVETEVADVRVKDALLDYLRASGRLQGMTPDTPLWVAHDRSGLRAGKPLSGHGFVKRMKRYAKLAGIANFHLHQTRHTFARIVSEATGSIVATQDALGHKKRPPQHGHSG